MAFSTVKKELNHLDKAKLIDLLGELYKSHKNVKVYLDHLANPDEQASFESFKGKLVATFYPSRGKIDLRKGKKVISEFKKLRPSNEKIAELMLVYVETGLEARKQFWNMDETYFKSMVSVFHESLKVFQTEALLNQYDDRYKKIIEQFRSVGWGFHEDIVYYYNAFYKK